MSCAVSLATLGVIGAGPIRTVSMATLGVYCDDTGLIPSIVELTASNILLTPQIPLSYSIPTGQEVWKERKIYTMYINQRKCISMRR